MLCALTVPALMGCGLNESPADFVLSIGAEPETLDPARITALTDARIAEALYEGVTVLDPATLTPQPAVASSWKVTDDGLVYTFFLRDCRWSDGTPVTAFDFVYSWRRVLDPRTAADYAYMLYCIEGAEAYNTGRGAEEDVKIRAPDAHTLEVRLLRPTAYFLDLTSFTTYLPVQRRCLQQHPDDWTRAGILIGNGPYVLQGRRVGQKLRLRKNPFYWDRHHVRSAVIDALTLDDSNTAFNIYETGGADLITAVPLPIVPKVMARPDYHSTPNLGTYFYRFQVTRPPFHDVRVRKAISLAINRREIVERITRGGEIPATSFVPPGIPGYPQLDLLRYDPGQARQLLAEAGYPGGRGFKEVELLYNTDASHQKVAEVIAYMLKTELGIRVTARNEEWKVFLGTVKDMNYAFARGGWYGDYTDPNTFLDMFVTDGGNNRTGWSMKRYDQRILAASVELDPKKRFQLLQEAETLLLEQMPIMPLYYYVSKNMYRKDVHGVYPNLRNHISLKAVWKD